MVELVLELERIESNACNNLTNMELAATSHVAEGFFCKSCPITTPGISLTNKLNPVSEYFQLLIPADTRVMIIARIKTSGRCAPNGIILERFFAVTSIDTVIF